MFELLKQLILFDSNGQDTAGAGDGDGYSWKKL